MGATPAAGVVPEEVVPGVLGRVPDLDLHGLAGRGVAEALEHDHLGDVLGVEVRWFGMQLTVGDCK